MNILFLDTETTGNDPQKDRLCQVCFKYSGGIETALFKPPIPISVKAMSVTHITNRIVEKSPAFKNSDFHSKLSTLLKNHTLVAHNAPFDVAILNTEGLEVPIYICTLRVARHLDTEGVIPEYGLQFLRYYLDIDLVANAHDAEGDVLVLEAVFNRLFKKIKEGGLSDEEVLQQMITLTNTPVLIKTFAFGKYKGMPVAEVAKKDRGYLSWLLKQKQEEGGTDEDWIHTLEHYLQ